MCADLDDVDGFVAYETKDVHDGVRPIRASRVCTRYQPVGFLCYYNTQAMLHTILLAPVSAGSFPIYNITQDTGMGVDDFGYPIDRNGDGVITNDDKYTWGTVGGVTTHVIDWYRLNALGSIPSGSMQCRFIQISASPGDVLKFQGKGTNTVELHRDSDWTYESARTLCQNQGLLYQAGSGSTNLADVNTGQTFEYTLSSTGTFLFTSSPGSKNTAGVEGQAVLVTVA